MARSRSYLEVRGGPHRSDLMTWPNPADPDDVAWRLLHNATIARQDVVIAASFIQAYAALIDLPQKARNQRIEQIKQAMRAIDTKEKP